MKRLFIGLLLMLWLNPVSAFAIGEVFKVKVSGKVYCSDFDVSTFEGDLWMGLDDTGLIISRTPDLTTDTTLSGNTEEYWINSKSKAFVLQAVSDDLTYVIMLQGKATVNKFGNVTKLKGTFMDWGEVCFSSGKFATTERLY